MRLSYLPTSAPSSFSPKLPSSAASKLPLSSLPTATPTKPSRTSKPSSPKSLPHCATLSSAYGIISQGTTTVAQPSTPPSQTLSLHFITCTPSQSAEPESTTPSLPSSARRSLRTSLSYQAGQPWTPTTTTIIDAPFSTCSRRPRGNGLIFVS
jgi:hypothetical protein